MRLKSYFAPSVQAAIALARREFGDEITLVTSHVAPTDARHLGEYEVVFDVEEELRRAKTSGVELAPAATLAAAVRPEEQTIETAPSTPVPLLAVPNFTAFQETLLEAVAPKPGADDEKAQKLRQIRLSLIELGVEAGLTRAIMSMLEGSIGKRTSRASNQTTPVIAPSAALTPAPVAQEYLVVRAETVAEAVTAGIAEAPRAAAGNPVSPKAATCLMTAAAEIVPFELSAQEQAAEQSGKVVVISKRRELPVPLTNAERPIPLPIISLATPPATHRPTVAELAFISSLSEAAPMERRAVGC